MCSCMSFFSLCVHTHYLLSVLFKQLKYFCQLSNSHVQIAKVHLSRYEELVRPPFNRFDSFSYLSSSAESAVRCIHINIVEIGLSVSYSVVTAAQLLFACLPTRSLTICSHSDAVCIRHYTCRMLPLINKIWLFF